MELTDEHTWIPVSSITAPWRALEKQRDKWIGHAISAALTAHGLRRKLAREQEHTRGLLSALKDIERGAGARETAMRALRAYALRDIVLAGAA